MKKVILILFLLMIASCNFKKDDKKIYKQEEGIITGKNLDVKDEFNREIFKVNDVYSEQDYNYIQMLANYNIGKFVYNEEFQKCLVDTALVKTKQLELFDVLQNPNDYFDEVILIDNFTLATLKYNGNFYVGLFKIIDADKYRCLDVLGLERYKNKESFFDLGDNKVFSYTCETSKGDFCFAVVTDKVNSLGKYDQILKAVKFDLVNEKIIEVDLQKEKIECLPEMSDE
jgi:hypothetical protein